MSHFIYYLKVDRPSNGNKSKNMHKLPKKSPKKSCKGNKGKVPAEEPDDKYMKWYISHQPGSTLLFKPMNRIKYKVTFEVSSKYCT